jgi:peptidoglycan/LPS O-acetylase OafA/YrhL
LAHSSVTQINGLTARGALALARKANQYAGLGSGRATESSDRTTHIYGFDGLRAISVTLVILSHIGIIAAVKPNYLKTVFTVFNGTYGVKTFFVLSGFLITTLLMKEYAQTRRINLLSFMVRRASRILPLYLLILAIAAALISVGIAEPSWNAMIFSALYLYNFIPQAVDVNYLSHLWSLAVEEQFYLVWPFVFMLLIPKKKILSGVCLVTILLCWATMGRNDGALTGSFNTARWTVPAIYPIPIGALLALNLQLYDRALRSKLTLGLSLCLIAAPLFVAIGPALEIANTFGVAGMVAWIYLNQQNVLVRSLDCGPIGYIGTISYGIYMWQGLFTGNGFYRAPGFESFPLEVHIGALLSIPTAMLSFHIFERPIARLGRRFKKWPLVGRSNRIPSAAEPAE